MEKGSELVRMMLAEVGMGMVLRLPSSQPIPLAPLPTPAPAKGRHILSLFYLNPPKLAAVNSTSVIRSSLFFQHQSNFLFIIHYNFMGPSSYTLTSLSDA